MESLSEDCDEWEMRVMKFVQIPKVGGEERVVLGVGLGSKEAKPLMRVDWEIGREKRKKN